MRGAENIRVVKRRFLILLLAGCSICESPLSVLADPISECMQIGRGTHMEGRWELVPDSERFRLCRDQETDRQRADQEVKQWQEEQRRLQGESTPGKVQQDKGTKRDQETGGQPVEPQERAVGDGELAPCTRPDIAGECRATPDQILYQIRRSKESGGETNW